MVENSKEVVKDFKTAHNELLKSLREENYTATQDLLQKQREIVDNFFIHMKKKCNIPLNEKEKTA